MVGTQRQVESSQAGTGGAGGIDMEYGAREEVVGLVTDQHGEGTVRGGKGTRCSYWCELLGGTEVSRIPRGRELR